MKEFKGSKGDWDWEENSASKRGEYMFEFEINRCRGCSLKEVLEFKEWTNSQLEEIWKLSVGDGVNIQGQLIRRIK